MVLALVLEGAMAALSFWDKLDGISMCSEVELMGGTLRAPARHGA